MKHLKYLFLFIGLALFASCSESDVEGGVIVDKNQAQFSGVVKELQTRVTGTSWDKNDDIGIYALIEGQEAVYDNMANVQYKTTSGDGVFAPVDAAIRFPDDGGNLDFVAYYPYNSNLTDLEYTVESGTDLLYSNNAKGKNNGTSDVSLEFKHALSKLVLNIGLGDNLTSLEGLTVAINNVSTTGKVDLANGEVTVDEAESITPTVVLAEGNAAATITELVMPTQDLQNAEVVFTLGENTYKWSPTEETVLASNTQYGYKLNLNVEAGELVAVEIGKATIGEWEKGHEDEGFTDLDPVVDEVKGTKENPYTVAEAFANQGEPDNKDYVWVKGYIVGYKSNGSYDVEFSTEDASGTNIIIADSKDETVGTKALGVQLAGGKARTDLNLASNPHMHKAEVLLYGTLEKYYSEDEGLKNVSEYELISTNPFFIADVNEVLFQASGDLLSSDIKITTDIETQEWTATSDAAWLSVDPTSGSGNGTATITVEVNAETVERTAKITLTPTGDRGLTPVVVDVTQAAAGEIVRDGLTKETAYIAADIAGNQGQDDVWVRAFIVGSDNGGLKIGVTGPGETGASGTNIVISDNINASTEAEIVRVALPTGNARNNLNLKDNPDKLKAEVYIKGNLEAYFGKPGMKEVKEYEVISIAPYFTADKSSISFTSSDDLTSIITLSTNDTQAWTAASSDATWLTVAPTSGTGSGDVTVTATENTAKTERTATVTLTATGENDFDPIVVNVTQGGTVAPPAEPLFSGSDFNDWALFESSLNSFGVKDYATQSATGGRDDLGAIHIKGTPTGNDFIFTAVVPEEFSAAGKTMIHFWIKGTADKSLSLNVYTDNKNYKVFNLGDATTADVVLKIVGSNQYGGTIKTGGEWIKVSLDISSIASQINTTVGENLFALKVGKEVAYDLYVDDITIE